MASTIWKDISTKVSAKARSNAIDRQLKLDSKDFKKQCKVLILGSDATRTLLQMRIAYGHEFSHYELDMYRQNVYHDLLDSGHELITVVSELGMEWGNQVNQENAKKVMEYEVEDSVTFRFDPGTIEAIHKIWKDPIIEEIMNHEDMVTHFLSENTKYFLEECLRFGSPSYIPSKFDILNASGKCCSTVVETEFQLESLRMSIIDVRSMRGDRRKWTHCFENLTTIVFCTSLASYDTVPDAADTSEKKTALDDALLMFESVVNSRWFHRTSIVLLLTRVDEFQRKLSLVPLERYYPDYTGGCDINKAKNYILRQFKRLNRARLSIYSHFGDDIGNGMRLIQVSVKETMLRNALEDKGVIFKKELNTDSDEDPEC